MKTIRTRSVVTPSGLRFSAGRMSPILTAAAAAALLSGIARAQSPQGGQVVNGQATISQNGNYTGITASNGAIINWQSFNIGQGQTVQFFQPNSSSRVLNRITGPDPSHIGGSLIANGNVYIVNPAGVFFAHGALVNVGGIYAAAGNITNADFINNVNHFTGVRGSVENRGTINSPSAHLVGQRAANYGTINAPNGMVTMSAGSDVFIGEQHGQIFARVSGGATGGTGVTQAGTINAAGGRVALGSGDMYAIAIDHPGSTKARDIRLNGGQAGVVSVSGTLDASDRSAGATGGHVEVLGDKVGIFGGHIDASGDAGGGTVLVGGDKQGQGSTRRADATYVSEDATINADAVRSGDGGKVIVWSDRFTNFQGRVSAKGGSQSGDGGFIETSGKKDLFMSGAADASATHGRAGSWLLDPTDVTLSNAVTSGGSLSGGGVFTPGANPTANVNLGQITTALQGGTSVTINTASAGAGNGDITLIDPLSVTLTGGDATLTLNAVRDIHIDNTITGAGAAGNALGVTMNAGRDITIGSAITLNGGALLVNAPGVTHLGANIDAGGGDIQFDSALVLASNVTLSGNDLTFNGTVDSDALATPRDLILNTTGGGITQFNADAGQTADLGTVTTNADGTTILNSMFLKGMAVTFNDAVRVDADAVVRGLTSVTFNSTIDSQATEGNDLQINSPLTALNGDVGNSAADTAMGLFQTNEPGTTTINTAVIKAARVNMRDAIILETATSITGTTSAAFGSTIDSATGEGNGIFVHSPLITLGGSIGQTGLLGFFRALVPGTTTITSAAISAVVLEFQSVVLGNHVTMGGSSVTFGGTLNSATGEARNLTIASALTTFNGNVGQTAGGLLGALVTNAAGSTVINAAQVSATSITFNDAVILGVTTAISASDALRFASTIDSQATESNSLSLAGATIALDGNIGRATLGLLNSLTTSTHSVTTINSPLISANAVGFDGAVVLGGNVSFGAGAVRFSGALNSEANEANSLTISSPQTIFEADVGQATGGRLGSITTDSTGSTTIRNARMNAGTMEFQDAVVIGGNAELTATTSLMFESTVDSAAGGHDLTVSAPNVTFMADIGLGSGGALGQFGSSAGTQINLKSGAVSADAIEFRGALVLGVDTTIVGTTSATFIGRIDSETGEANDLLINSPLTLFGGRIGENSTGSGLGQLSTNVTGTTTIQAPSITADIINFADAVVIDGITTLRGATSVTFGGTLDGSIPGRELTINSALTTFSGRVGNSNTHSVLGKLATDAAGTTVINTDIVKATEMEFSDPVVIGVTTALTGATSVEFQGTVNSEAGEANGLTVNSATTAFNGTVGAGTGGALGALVTDDPGTTLFGGTVQAASVTCEDTVNINGVTVTTTLDQTYNGSVFLGADTTLSGRDIAFNLALNSGIADRALTINTTGGGTTIINGPVGAINPLKSITTNADGRTVLSGGQIITGGDQIYNDPVTLGLTTNISGTNITFSQTVDSDTTARTLNVNSTGNGTTLFAGVVGGINPLLRLTTNADGTTRINGGSVTTTSTQAYNDAVTLTADTTLAGGSVAFGSTLNSDSTARTLAVNTSGSGQTTFSGAVGGSAPLSSLTTNADGTTRLFGGSIRTVGDQTFGDAVVLGANATLTGNDITFSSTIDSTSLLAAAALTVTSTTNGVTTFNGAIGSTNAIKGLTTNADGKTRIGANITTTDGSIILGDAVLVFRDAVLTDNGGTGISFGNTIDSEGAAHALSVLTNTSSNATASAPTLARIVFGGNIGSTLALSQFRIGGNRSIVPTAATIVAGLNANGSQIPGFSLSINTTGAFTMGAFQKMSVVGNITITSGGQAALSDISALGNITVNAPSIVIRTRPGASLLVNQRGTLVAATDGGTDFVAGGTINFSVAPGLIGGFGSPSFATVNSTGISATLQGFPQRSFGSAITQDLLHLGTNGLDLAATGPSNTNIADALAGAVPTATQSGVVQQDTAAGRAEREELNNLGIVTRSPDETEFLQLLLGKTMVSDVTDRTDPSATDHTISLNRLSANVVRRVIETYRSVFWQETYDAEGNVTRSPQPERVSQALSAAWAEYAKEAKGADAPGFRAYLEAVPSRAEALNYLNGLRELFSELGYLGLSPVENRIARNSILRSVPVQGMTPAQLEVAITSRQMGGS